MNIMLAGVVERRREIGTRRALGARQKDILLQFLVESAVLCCLGGLVGVAFLSSAFYLRYKHFRGNCGWLSRRVAPFFSATGYCLWVYVLNLLPYILVARSAFIYHYMPALMYAEVMSALVIEQFVGKRNMPAAMKVLSVVVIGSFLFYSPWVYAYPLTSESHARRRLLKRWDVRPGPRRAGAARATPLTLRLPPPPPPRPGQ